MKNQKIVREVPWRPKGEMVNAEAALVQRVNTTVCPFGVGRETPRSHSTLCFVRKTRPGSHMLWDQLPNAQPLGLQEWSSPGATSRAAPAMVAEGQGGQMMGVKQEWARLGQHVGCFTAGLGSTPSCSARCPGATMKMQAGVSPLLSPPCLLSTAEVFELTHVQTSFSWCLQERSPLLGIFLP